MQCMQKLNFFLSEPLQDLLLARVMMAQVPRITLRKGQAQKLSFGAWPQREEMLKMRGFVLNFLAI